MKISKKSLLSVALSFCLAGGATTALAEVGTAMDNHRYMGNISYNEYMEQSYLKGNIPGADQNKLKDLYSKIQSIRFKGKHKEFNALWDQFDAIVDKHYVQPENTCISLEDMLEPAGLNPISESDYAQMEKIYDNIVSFEKAGESEKAAGHWESFDKIYDKYIPTTFIGMP